MQKLTASSLFKSALWKQKTVFAEAVVLTVVINLIGLATAMYAMQIYDRVIPNNGIDTMIVLSIGVLIAIMIDLVFKQSRSLMVDKACKAIDFELSDKLFARAMDIRMDKRPNTIGSFAAQIRSFEYVRNFMTSTTLFLLADIPFALVFIGIIAMIAGPLALVPLLLLPVTIAVGLLFIKPVSRLALENAVENNHKNGLLIESIDGIESIKSLGAKGAFLNRWNELTKKVGENDLTLKKWTGLSSHLSGSVQQLSYLGLVAFGVILIINGELTMGGLIATTIIGGRALTPLSQVANVVVQWQQAKAALKGLEPMMASVVDGETLDGSPLVKPEIANGEFKLSSVVFAYQGQHNVLAIENLNLTGKDNVAVIGGIGSGKSTLLKLLSGLYIAENGRVFFDNVDMGHLDPEFVRSKVLYVPQQIKLFNGSLKDNLCAGLEGETSVNDTLILKACEMTGLIKLVQAHPKGLGLEIQEGGKGLSGGQQQLVGLTQAVLRILITRPPVLLLDESTSALDGQTEMKILTALFALMKEVKGRVIFVTHKMQQLNHADKVIVMDQGKLVAFDDREVIVQKLKVGGAA